jgi:hypothetical protein
MIWCDVRVMWCDMRMLWCDVMWSDLMWCEGDVRVMWCDMMWGWYEVMCWCKYPCYVNDTSRNLVVIFFCGISIHSMSATSYKISWWDISVVQVSMLCQWYLTKLVGEIFLWYKYPCYVNDFSRNWLVRYFCGTSIQAMSMISYEDSWWDLLWFKYLFYVNDISQN